MDGVYVREPQAIEAESVRIVEELLGPLDLEEEAAAVLRRMVHAAGDPSLASLFRAAPGAARAGVAALRAGAGVYTDVEMVRAGINKRLLGTLGGEAVCAVSREGVAEAARRAGTTRSEAGLRLLGERLAGQVVAVGNAPTALFTVLELARSGVRPALVVGMPVGFVGAARSKAELAAGGLPYLTVEGTRGGSTLAAAAVNALLILAAEGS